MSKVLVSIGGLLILASAIPHALLGWPPAAEQLRASGVDANLIGGLAVGWHFGSAAMVALGAVVLLAVPHLSTTHWAWRVPLCVGIVYTLFGVAALLYRSLSPHFLAFVAIGALLVVGSGLGRRAGSSASVQ